MTDGLPTQRLNVRDLIAGIITIAVGVVALYDASHYPMGTLLRMGPGFFPAILACIMLVLGTILLLQGLSRQSVEPTRFLLRPVVMISLGIASFAVLLERLGLAPATTALVFLSSLSEPMLRPLRSLALAGAMVALVYVVFIAILRLPIPVLTW